MLLNGGEGNGARILRSETVAWVNQNHIGELQAGRLPSQLPERAHDFELFPNMSVRWGLAYLLNTQPSPHGRSAAGCSLSRCRSWGCGLTGRRFAFRELVRFGLARCALGTARPAGRGLA